MSNNITKQPCAIILTALRIEYQEVRAHVDELKKEEGAPRGTTYQRGSFTARGCTWSIGLVTLETQDLGNGLEVERAISHFKPDIILFVGIVSGLNKIVAVGDIVAATKVYSTKIYNDETGLSTPDLQPGPAAVYSAYPLVKVAQAEARSKSWSRSIQDSRPSNAEPRAFIAPIIAIENMVYSSKYTDDLRTSYPDAVALEAQQSKFLQAVRTHYLSENTLIIRGIAGGVGEEPSRENLQLAAQHASSFAFSVLASYGAIEQRTRSILPPQSSLAQELRDASPVRSIRIFYAYAREDERYVKRLQLHLAILKRLGLITDWYAGRIMPGENRQEQVKQHLNTADIILLLISPDFINSEDLYRARTLEKQRHANEAIIIPILLRPTEGWQQYLAPGNLPVFPRDGHAIDDAPDPNIALIEVAREIRSIVEKLRSIRSL